MPGTDTSNPVGLTPATCPEATFWPGIQNDPETWWQAEVG